jgi:hypothetical protein
LIDRQSLDAVVNALSQKWEATPHHSNQN